MKKNYFLIFPTLLLLVSCYKEDDYSLINQKPDDIIKSITIDKKKLLGNGSDKAKITVELPIDASDQLSIVNLKTDKGTFVETGKSEYQTSAKLINDNNTLKRTATAVFQSALSDGIANIEVTVSGTKKNEQIILDRNNADKLSISPASSALQLDFLNELKLVVKLSSKNGKVTPGQNINLFVSDKMGTAKGSFRVAENTSNDSGECNYIFSILPDITFTGDLNFIAQTTDKLIKSDTVKVVVFKK